MVAACRLWLPKIKAISDELAIDCGRVGRFDRFEEKVEEREKTTKNLESFLFFLNTIHVFV